MNPNPLEAMRQAQAMPKSLQDEMDENTSLEKRQANGREPVSDAYIDKRLRSDKPITFLDFIDDLRKLWEAAGKSGKIIRHSPMKEVSESPTITYRIIRRVLNEHFKDIKPRYRGVIRHPYIEGEYVELYGQVFDLWVEFGIHSKSAEEADELVMELEEFLQTYAGFFKANGVQEILFHAQGEDDVLEEHRVITAKRKILYTIRFEKIIVRFLNEIQQIAVQANLRSEGEIS